MVVAAALIVCSGCIDRSERSQRAPAPQFSYTLLDGARKSSEALRGKVVLVNFWATTCASCIQEMPQLVATHRQFQPRGFETLAVR